MQNLQVIKIVVVVVGCGCVRTHALASVEDDDNTSQNISSTYRNTYALKKVESHLLTYKVMIMATNIFPA